MGSAAALSLRRRGVRTVLIEQFDVGHRHGASHGAVRIFRLSYPNVDYVRLSQRALPLWRLLEDEAGERLLVTTGLVDQQISNDPGGTRWKRLIDDAVDMFFAFATATSTPTH